MSFRAVWQKQKAPDSNPGMARAFAKLFK